MIWQTSCVLLLLLFSQISIARETYPPKYSYDDPITSQHLVCDQCPPGTYVTNDCTSDQKTECMPCPRNHYADTWNPYNECQYCSAVCKELQYVKQECNNTHNRVCECIKGYYLYFEFCVAHTNCPLGYGVSQLGTPESDTVCKKCPKGTFSNVISESAACQMHTDCDKRGLRTKNMGDYENDALCEESMQETTHDCDLDISLCEEAMFRLPVNFSNWLTVLAEELPGKKVKAQQIERITQHYNPEDQPFYLFKVWKEENKALYSSYPFIQGLKICEKMVLKHFRNLNLSTKDITGFSQHLHGKKIEQMDIESTVKMCDPSKQILKVLDLWRMKNEGNTIKVLNQLKPQHLNKALRRRMKKLKKFMNSVSMHTLHQNILKNIVNPTQPDKLNTS